MRGNSLVLLGLLLPATSSAAVCTTLEKSLLLDPAPTGFWDGELGVPRRVCPRDEVGLGGNGLVVIDTADFYGQIRAAALAHGSWALSPRLELFGQLEALRYQTVISSVSASDLGLGHLSLGSTYTPLERETYALAVSGRVVLPTAFGLYEHAWPLAVDVGTAAAYQLHRTVVVRGSVGLAASWAVSRGAAQPRAGLLLTLGGGWQPVTWFGVVTDLVVGTAYRAPLDQLGVAPALRFAVRGRVVVDLGGAVPLAGRERSLAAVTLRVSWLP